MFCKHCGKQLSENAQFCPNCGWERYVPVPFKCENCGTIIPKGSEFCTKCGWSVEKSKAGKFLKNALIYGMLAFLVLILFLMFIGFLSILFNF